MKNVFCFILIVFIFVNIQAQEKYISAMTSNIALIDSATTPDAMLNLANKFERIALTEKDKWLPYYYASMLYTTVTFIDTINEKKDSYLDKADIFINKADSLQPNESENYTLMLMIAQARMQIDPMNRWAKYGADINKYYQLAVESDSLNPRPYYLMGVQTFYTPESFGGGPIAAKPYFEKSLEKYDAFIPKDELIPRWGRDSVVYFLMEMDK